MIPVNKLKADSLDKATAGDFFLPRDPKAAKFIVGTLNGKFTVAVSLDTPNIKFHDMPQMSGRRGVICRDYDLLVNPNSASAYLYRDDQKADFGALVLSGESAGIYANSPQNSAHVVMLVGKQITEEDQDAVAFSDWSVVLNLGHGQQHELFHRKSREETEQN